MVALRRYVSPELGVVGSSITAAQDERNVLSVASGPRYFSSGGDGSKSEKKLAASDTALGGSGKRSGKRTAETYHGDKVKLRMLMA